MHSNGCCGHLLAGCCKARPNGAGGSQGDVVTTLMFPIGQSLGAYFFGAGPNDHVRRVRLGHEIVELTDHEFAVWSLAHGLSEEPGEGEAASGARTWDRDRVAAAFEGSEIGGAAIIVDRLLDRGLLAEVDVTSPAASDFARQHRLLPLQLGMGNSTEYRTMYVVGTVEQPLAGMTRLLYGIFLWGHLAPNLLAACEVQDESDPRDLLAKTLAVLHTLLTPNAVCLDLVIPEYAS